MSHQSSRYCFDGWNQQKIREICFQSITSSKAVKTISLEAMAILTFVTSSPCLIVTHLA